jgi:2-amino-4-hydroxy-6-hydroxymethyldihydropteridine diphosphokinase
MNSACLLIGSNIEPERNTQRALAMLRSMVTVDQVSRAWVIPSFGSPGPDFINLAVQISTGLSKAELKSMVISEIERKLHRVRSSDKNAPRTIDLDIILFNDELQDPEIWRRPYVVLPVADLEPELRHPSNDLSLREIADKIQRATPFRQIDNFPLA